MRIIGHIEHPVLKITVFQMDNKLSIKLESGLYEQTYKLRSNDQIQTMSDIEKIVDQQFIQEVIDRFPDMHKSVNAAIQRNLSQQRPNEFEEII